MTSDGGKVGDTVVSVSQRLIVFGRIFLDELFDFSQRLCTVCQIPGNFIFSASDIPTGMIIVRGEDGFGAHFAKTFNGFKMLGWL